MNEIPAFDELLGRVVSGDATLHDWRDIARRAMDDDSIWRQVNAAMMIDRAIADEMSQAADRAALVHLPMECAVSDRPLSARLIPWTGWLAAACIALFAAMGSLIAPSTSTPPHTAQTENAGGGGAAEVTLSANEAWREYLDAGRREGVILDQLPLLTMRAVPAADGVSIEVTYVRRIIERNIVGPEQVFELAADEHGRPVSVPAGEALLGQRRNSL